MSALYQEEHMLHFITDAPSFLVREVMPFVKGFIEAPEGDFPAWVSTIIHVDETDAFALLSYLKGHRVESRRPARVAIGDPTFVLAAAAIERGNGGSASGAAFAR